MANQLVNFDYFTFTNICSTFKVPLTVYDADSQCRLTIGQKKAFSFACGVCGWLQELDLGAICDEQTVRWLKKRVNFLSDDFVPDSFLQEIKKREEQYYELKILEKRFQKIFD